MLAFLPPFLRSFVCGALFLINTAIACVLIYILAFPKLLIPIAAFRRLCTRLMVRVGENWISGNAWNLRITQAIRWDIQGLGSLKPDRSYLVFANHQSWVDIIVLQQVFNRRIPFLRFFLKQELLYVPFLGLAWWALDFPFMKRYSRSYLEKHPEKRGEDLETTRRACERFRESRVSILNFLEGTRLNATKHAATKSPYRHLLTPKAGGVAFVLQAMGDQFHTILDVTIAYPKGVASFGGLLAGRLSEVVVRVRELAIPPEFLQGDYLNDEAYRERFQTWVREIWQAKDEWLDVLAPPSLEMRST